MEEQVGQINKINKLARDILILSRNTLLVNLRFLDVALSQFELFPYKETTVATDGKRFLYNARYILLSYKNEKELPVRDYLHVVFHCVFRHMYIHTLINQDCWNLACDIAVECMITELGLKSTAASRQQRQAVVISELQSELKKLTAEKIYRYYLDKNLPEQKMNDLKALFVGDDHCFWYLPPDEQKKRIPNSNNQSDNNSNDNNDKKAQKETQRDNNVASNQQNLENMVQKWKEISERIQKDLETFSKEQGDKSGLFMQNLTAINREKYNYESFLRKFAVRGEVIKINDDEFDYLFYTYGLKLYKKMPLIEPLEYKEVKRIKEFVIAIDTSGSVSGELVQKFIQKTYNLLKSTESFFSKINLHIIQCDAAIQEDVKITSQDEFDNYLKHMQIKGLGGTDFRPVFNRVDEMVRRKEFTNLKGLIYFTDGYGTFPVHKPEYDTAFVFIDDNYENPEVPPWAIKLVLQKDEI